MLRLGGPPKCSTTNERLMHVLRKWERVFNVATLTIHSNAMIFMSVLDASNSYHLWCYSWPVLSAECIRPT